ncbi:hypothetical protein VSS74_19230 [Conexibacter stalactiti]|uniref:Uncharacterized protein n=1 Tax=Conexibacter stalactiti TaxID=1940611 RepID=A0ABU4HT88_9ACTN|nr:hypothetical protein [Conexibacter stalactiti]MDW5596488.1 hypothetical protein [Conexibacter stalactiti]MEC5037130.1 hypothetical protein [Conexibacter stalactiti]
MGKKALTAALAAACLVTLAASAPAAAEFGIESFDTDTHTPIPDPSDPDAAPSRHLSQAGAHADSTVRFRVRTKGDGHGYTITDGSLKDVVLDLPPGFAGNPQAVPQCNPAHFNNLAGENCPPSTQVGFARTELPNNSLGRPNFFRTSPVYNLRPAAGETAAFGFYVVFVPVKIVASVRSDGDFGLRTTVGNISQAATVFGQELTLWGVPADPVHDYQRYSNGLFSATGASAGVEPRPFLTLPPACNGPQVTTLRARPWGGGGWVETQDVADDPVTGDTSGPKGCEKLGFGASLSMRPNDTRAAAPAPYTARLNVALDENPRGLATANVRNVQVTLPEGVSISPSSADGLGACRADQLGLGTAAEPTCPDSSKIGDVEIETPLLPSPLTGEVYLRAPTPERMFAIALVVRGHGLLLKLPGEIDPDPVTGRISTSFSNNPQLPFEQLTLRFKGGPRAPLTNPRDCGPKTTTTTITSWAGHRVTSEDTFTIDRGPDGGPCRALGFAPSFAAGSVDPAAGRSSTFTLAFGRGDADHDLSTIDVRMPPGLTGRLAIADQCADALAAAGGCPASARVGSVTVGSGAGASPFYLPGRVYMTGPYKGAPLGLAIVVPAVAGPFDLGTVVVRAAVFVDRSTAALRVVADPMPTILEGVPLRVRAVNVRIDRDGFMVNPTGCGRKQVTATIGSAAGSSAAVASRFAAVDCGSRPLKPAMTLAVGARGKLTRGKRTPFTATLAQTPGQGNLKSVEVTLPKTLNSRLDVVNRREACSIEQFAADRCPMRVGTGTAVTPLLRQPLTGPAYFVYNPARRLPDLVVRLKGQVAVDLVGKVTITRDLRLRTTFDAVPDVPISRFRLALASGPRNGPIGVVRDLCGAEARAATASIAFVGHNGKRVDLDQRLRINGCRATTRARGAAKKTPTRRNR